jgi:predicted nucleic acid-binding protein
MKILFDTSFLVEIDRKNSRAIALAKKLVEKGAELYISTVTVSEIIAGAYLRQDFKKAIQNARLALAQFDWQEVDAAIAFKTGELLAYQLSHGRTVDYQDTVIAATAIELNASFVVSQNERHFTVFPKLEGKVLTVEQANQKIK